MRGNDDSPTAGQNVGYADKSQHSYWHFKDIKFSSDGRRFLHRTLSIW